MTDPRIKKILACAVYAPSGDNAQPWQFSCDGNIVDVLNIPNRDNPLFNYAQRGSYIAHGALIENISVLSKSQGLAAHIALFPDSGNRDITARITFEPGAPASDDREAVIKNRCTNRKKFFSQPLTENQRAVLEQPYAEQEGAHLQWTSRPEAITAIASVAGTAEQVMLQHQPLHQAFFSLVRWSEQEERQHGFGMPIDTLELLPPQKLMFKWLSHWRAAAPLRAFGLPGLIAKENAKTYATASAMAAVFIPDNRPERFIGTGRILQQAWLNATAAGLEVQPLAGVLYLNQRLLEHENHGFPPRIQKLISNAVRTMHGAFPGAAGHMSMLVRMGPGPAPGARSRKLPPVILEKHA